MSTTSRRPVITLLTDYGVADEFAGVLHGVIARICPEAQVIDLSHGVDPQNVAGGAALLAQTLPFMPIGVHVAVVDPGVGGPRRAVALELADGRMLVGPDNGLLWSAAQAGGGIVAAAEILASPWRLEPVSATFHGRDIFAPVAAHLAAGEPFARSGDAIDPHQLVQLELPSARVDEGVLRATVLGTDHFGNVQLGASVQDLAGLGVGPGQPLRLSVRSGETHLATRARIFADVDEQELVVFEDSSQRLALACNHGNAAARVGLSAGDVLELSPVERP